jgi:hypothetical protein
MDQGYVTPAQFERLAALATEVGRMIAALMNYLRRSGTKGLKYKAI